MDGNIIIYPIPWPQWHSVRGFKVFNEPRPPTFGGPHRSILKKYLYNVFHLELDVVYILGLKRTVRREYMKHVCALFKTIKVS